VWFSAQLEAVVDAAPVEVLSSIEVAAVMETVANAASQTRGRLAAVGGVRTVPKAGGTAVVAAAVAVLAVE
jgi:hypothetical protein